MRRAYTVGLPAAFALCIAATFTTNASAQNASCARSISTIKVPQGFCIEQAADSLSGLRHFKIAANGDLFAATRNGLVLMHDTNRDGRYDTRKVLYPKSGNDVLMRDASTIYFTPNDAVVRIKLRGDDVVAVDTIVQGLPTNGDHKTKSITFDRDGALLVDMGSATNSCQPQNRVAKVAGVDPCTELETRAGVWRFDADKTHQTQTLDKRYATGLRNVVALTTNPATREVFGLQHGRDQLADNWGYTAEQSAELPAEIMVQINKGDDFGWPFCYHDQIQGKTVLAPEYGGDGKTVGRCSRAKAPIAAFPGHWAPESVEFYTGTQFPAQYRGGAFIAFHGSWNRSPLPQAGFNVVFQPMKGSAAAGKYMIFADGFQDARINGGTRPVQPMGLAVGPDGSLYVGSDNMGLVWRIRADNGRR